MKKTILFSKIHYSGLFSINFKEHIFKDLLDISNKNDFIISGIYKWYFSKIEKENIDGKEYIVGKINKVIPSEENVSIDKSTKEEKRIINTDIKDNESNFVIYSDKNLIGFETSKTLTKNQFILALQDGFKQTFLNNLPVFDLIYDEKFLLEMLKNFSKVYFANFNLKTTNPDAREDFKQIDDLFRATNSETNKLVLKPKEGESLNFKDKDSLIKQGLSMSASGYGSALVTGIGIDGNKFSIRTGEKNLKQIIISEERTDKEIKRQITFTFESLINNS